MTTSLRLHQWRAQPFVMATLALLLAFTSVSFHSAAVRAATLATMTQVSSDPYTERSTQHKTEVEPAVSSFGSTLVSAFQVGRSYDGGSSNIGWATSLNKGRTWHHGFLPGLTTVAGGKYERGSDAAVVYDAKHKTWLISTLAILNLTPSGGNDVVVSRSSDGLTWSNPVAVSIAAPKNNYDKEWITCDNTTRSPYYGHCYVEWDDAANNGLVLMSTSPDGGTSWSPPKSPANANSFFGIGGEPVVQPNGTVVVPLLGTSFQTQITSVVAFTSQDGGASWTDALPISPLTFHVQTASYRGGSLPSVGVDRAGTVSVVWSDCRFEAQCRADDLVLSTSTDGLSWTAVRRLPLDPVGSGVDHFTPGLGVDPLTDGHLALTFYYFTTTNCFTYNCHLHVGFVSSTNGGTSWSEREHVAGPLLLPWLADTASGFMTGDYIATTIVGTSAYPIFALATAPSGGSLHESMYTTVNLKVMGGSMMPAGEQPVVTPGSVPAPAEDNPFISHVPTAN